MSKLAAAFILTIVSICAFLIFTNSSDTFSINGEIKDALSVSGRSEQVNQINNRHDHNQEKTSVQSTSVNTDETVSTVPDAKIYIIKERDIIITSKNKMFQKKLSHYNEDLDNKEARTDLSNSLKFDIEYKDNILKKFKHERKPLNN